MFSAAFGSLRALPGTKPVWKLDERYPERVQTVAVNRSLPVDFDRWEDYEQAPQH